MNDPNLLTDEQMRALIEWLEGRRSDIEGDIEDLGVLKPLLTLLSVDAMK